MSRYILTILSWICILAMFAYIGYGLAKQFDPPSLYLKYTPSYTNQAFRELEREATAYKAKWRDADRILMEIGEIGE